MKYKIIIQKLFIIHSIHSIEVSCLFNKIYRGTLVCVHLNV